MALAVLIFVATLGLRISFEGIFGCAYEIQGLESMITLTTDFMLEPLSYEIVNLFTRVVVDKTLSLVGTSQYFKFEDGTLIRRQCLPVGHDERLAFFITGTQGCLPKLMTVVVEPTLPVFAHYYPGSMVFVDTCIPEQTERVNLLEFENDPSCVKFNCTIESYSSSSHTFWVEDLKHRRRRQVIGSKYIVTSTEGVIFNFAYYLRVDCFDNSVTAPSFEKTAAAFLNVTFVRADSCSTSTTSTSMEITTITTSSTTTPRRTMTPTASLKVSTGLSVTSIAQPAATASTPSTSTITVTGSPANSVTVGLSTPPNNGYSTGDNEKTFFNKPVNVAVISAVGGVVLIGLVIAVLSVKYSSCSKVIPAGMSEPGLDKEN